MKQDVVLLAFTKMRAGFCLAGIAPETGKWVRPVKEFGILQTGDVLYPNRIPFTVLDRVTLTLRKPRPQSPHVEDWICDFVRERPERAGRLEEEARTRFLEAHAETDTAPLVSRFDRSLLLTRVPNLNELFVSFALDAATGKLDARMACAALGLPSPVPVTDLRWRALGRLLLAHSGSASLNWSASALFPERRLEQVYLALGLSREFEGRLWPLVVGVHCVPDFTAPLDLKQP